MTNKDYEQRPEALGMMKIEEFEEKMAELEKLQAETEKCHAKLKAQIDELKALRKEPPHPRPCPKYYQTYFYVDSTGEVNETNWAADQLDQKAYEFCNVFRAKEDTEFAIERLKVLGEIEEWSGEYGDPVSIAYYENDGKVEPIDALYPNRGEAVFANYEDADGCIRAIGQGRLKKYYFMIPEDGNDDD